MPEFGCIADRVARLMRVGLYQSASPAGNMANGLAVINTALNAAAKAGVDMLTLPELFLPGYNTVTSTPPPEWDAVLPKLADMCKSTGTALTIGLPEYAGGAVFNSAYAIGADGQILAKYRKIQLFGAREAALFAPGDQLITFDYLGTCFGLMICYDIEFPEHTRALVRAGAEVILTPTANMMPFVNVCLIQVPGRAMENGVTIVYANYTGSEGDLDYVGYSVIAGPDGYPLGSKAKGEGLVVAVLPEGSLENGIPFSTQLADLRGAKEP